MQQVKRVQGEIIKKDLNQMQLWNVHVIMSSKCENVEDACNVFDKMPQQNVVSWTAVIACSLRYIRPARGLNRAFPEINFRPVLKQV